MSLDQDGRKKSYRLQVAGVWIGGAGLVVALFRAVFDLWNVVGR